MYKYAYWEDTDHVAINLGAAPDDCYDYQINSEDKHLQYGPISTALRERVMVGPFKAKDFDLAWQYFKARFNDYYKIPDEDLLMTLLIVAELFADEGL
jgi:hypothetical protein